MEQDISEQKSEGGVVRRLLTGVKKFLILFFSIVGAVVAIVLIGLSFDSNSTHSEPPVVEEMKKEYSDVEVYTNAQIILEEFLKSPSTAEYPYLTEAVIERYKDDTFKITSYVDSQNGFGAMIRSEWMIILRFVDSSVVPMAVVIDGEVLFKDETSS